MATHGRPEPAQDTAGLATSGLHPLSLNVDWARAVLEGGAPWAGDLWQPPPVGAGDAPAVRFANARVRERGRRLLHQRQVMFCFKVVYRSDETREQLVSLWVDPLTEAADPVPILPGLVDMVPEGEAPLDGYPLQRLYRRACQRVRQAVLSRGRQLEQEAQQRLARDMVRLEDYYAGLREEALEPVARDLHRLEAARNRQRLWRFVGGPSHKETDASEDAAGGELAALRARVDDILAALAADRQRRIQEIRAKYRVRAEVALVGAALVWAPRVEMRCKLLGPAARDVVFYYDPVRSRFLDLECEGCGAPLTEVYLCAEGDLVCARCFAPCAGCGQALCQRCTPCRCHLCDAPLCGRCDAACPLAAGGGAPAAQAAAAGLRLSVCPACRTRTCPDCVALSQVMAG